MARPMKSNVFIMRKWSGIKSVGCSTIGRFSSPVYSLDDWRPRITSVETIELVREGNTARVTRNTVATAHGKTPIRFSSSSGRSIVVRSSSISTLASAGILTADSFGVILFRKRNTIKVRPVSAAEQAKKIPAAMVVDGDVVTEMMEAIGGNSPDKPCPVIKA